MSNANLVLNGHSIDTIDDIKDNYVEEELLAAYRSGLLVAWLRANFEDEIAEKICKFKDTGNVAARIITALGLDEKCLEETKARIAKEKIKKLRQKEIEKSKKKKDEDVRNAALQKQEVACNSSLRGIKFAKRSVLFLFMRNFIDAAGDKHRLQELEKSAEAGNAYAKVKLGVYYLWALGVEEDHAKAVAMFKSAGWKHKVALFNIAVCYDRGWGVRSVMKEAAEYSYSSAAKGYAPAQLMYSHCRSLGNGVGRSSSDADYYKRMAYKSGCFHGARDYSRFEITYDEESTPYDSGLREIAIKMGASEGLLKQAEIYYKSGRESDAFRIYRKLSELGILTGDIHFRLFLCYLNGQGCKKDLDAATYHFYLAANLQYENAWTLLAMSGFWDNNEVKSIIEIANGTDEGIEDSVKSFLDSSYS